MIFCDSSALAKYYVDEPESRTVRSRLDSEDVAIASELARIELMSTFHRQLRERRWPRGQFQDVAAQFNRDDAIGFWRWAPLNSFIIGAASQLYIYRFLKASSCAQATVCT